MSLEYLHLCHAGCSSDTQEGEEEPAQLAPTEVLGFCF